MLPLLVPEQPLPRPDADTVRLHLRVGAWHRSYRIPVDGVGVDWTALLFDGWGEATRQIHGKEDCDYWGWDTPEGLQEALWEQGPRGPMGVFTAEWGMIEWTVTP